MVRTDTQEMDRQMDWISAVDRQVKLQIINYVFTLQHSLYSFLWLKLDAVLIYKQ